MDAKPISAEEESIIRATFACDDKGNLWRLNRKTHTGRKEQPVGVDNGKGYLRSPIEVSGKQRWLMNHRVIWFLRFGTWPLFIDHRDGVRMNNARRNLREADRRKNTCNSKARSSSNVCPGVHKHSTGKGYVASITPKGMKPVYKYFITPRAAVRWRKAQERLHYEGYTRN